MTYSKSQKTYSGDPSYDLDHILNLATEAFASRFSKHVVTGAETIGLEPEMLAVDENGRAASYDTICAVFNDVIANGAEPIIDEGTGSVVGVDTTNDGVSFSIGTDVGHAIIESQLPPAKTLFEAQTLRKKVLTPIISAFSRHGVTLLGYGVLPLDKPSQTLRAPKGRYIFF